MEGPSKASPIKLGTVQDGFGESRRSVYLAWARELMRTEGELAKSLANRNMRDALVKVAKVWLLDEGEDVGGLAELAASLTRADVSAVVKILAHQMQTYGEAVGTSPGR